MDFMTEGGEKNAEIRGLEGSAGEATYLTLECWARELVIALDIFLDGLAGGTVAFFELGNQPTMIKPAGHKTKTWVGEIIATEQQSSRWTCRQRKKGEDVTVLMAAVIMSL